MERFDNAWHPRKSTYKEWWYFTLFCDDGSKIAGALSVSDKDSDIWISYYGKHKKEIERKYPLKRFWASEKVCEVSIGKNRLTSDDSRLDLHILEDNFKLDISARNTVRWKDNTLKFGIGKKQVRWIVPFLRGEFAGEVQIGQTKKTIKGLLFHDHVWHTLKGDLDLLINMRSWVWGIGYTKDTSLLFVDVKYQKKPFRFVCLHDAKGVQKTNAVRLQRLTYPLKDFRADSSVGRWVVRIDKNHHIPLKDKVHEFFVGLFRKKYHSLGSFRANGEKGEMYVEALRYH
jgi:hypothetical protein